MKLKTYLEKQLQKALDHQEEHPVSGSANRDVKEARKALKDYLKEVSEYRMGDFESMGWLNRGD